MNSIQPVYQKDVYSLLIIIQLLIHKPCGGLIVSIFLLFFSHTEPFLPLKLETHAVSADSDDDDLDAVSSPSGSKNEDQQSLRS